MTTRNLSPYRTGPDIHVQVIQHPDGTDDESTLSVRVDDEEFTGEDARHLARSLKDAAETFERWSVITQPRVKPIECMTWCADGDGHPRELFSEDQTCRGEFTVTVLSLADQSEAGELASYAKRSNGGEEHVCLNILVGDTDVDVPMTPAEARRVANGLLDAAEQVDGQPS